MTKICGRCYDEVNETFPTNCRERPEKLIHVPMGMYHCPDCGAMLLAGLSHPDVCKRCQEFKHPAFDTNFCTKLYPQDTKIKELKENDTNPNTNQ